MINSEQEIILYTEQAVKAILKEATYSSLENDTFHEMVGAYVFEAYQKSDNDKPHKIAKLAIKLYKKAQKENCKLLLEAVQELQKRWESS